MAHFEGELHLRGRSLPGGGASLSVVLVSLMSPLSTRGRDFSCYAFLVNKGDSFKGELCSFGSALHL